MAMPLPMLGSGWATRLESVASALLSVDSSGTMASFRQSVPSLCRYLDLLVDWNSRLDLTAARSEDELVDVALADALVLASATAAQTPGRPPPRWVDVGSGAGAPALVLALLRPDLELTLIEPKSKRVAFLRTCAGALGLGNVEVRRCRAEQLDAQSYDVALSRATLPPDLWLSEGARLAHQSVWVLIARGAAPLSEDLRLADDRSYRWPLTGSARRALRYEATSCS